MSNKHTPGPWQYLYDEEFVKFPIVQRRKSGGFQVADNNIARAKADALLIAAAPIMLEVLEDVCNWCGQENLKTCEVVYKVRSDCKDCKVAAAIKAAKGKA